MEGRLLCRRRESWFHHYAECTVFFITPIKTNKVPQLIKQYNPSLTGGSIGSNDVIELCFGLLDDMLWNSVTRLTN